MAEKYEVTDYRGTIYKVDDNNKFTGEVMKMWDSCNKQISIDELVNKYNVDLSSSFSYGDTNGDLSMLKMVENPIAINPNRNLLLKIKEDDYLAKRIKIIVERKDIIYKLNSDVEIIL